MKTLFLSIFVLASLTSQASPIMGDYTEAEARDTKEATAGYCNNYNETALRTIYKNLRATDISGMQAQLMQNKLKNNQCDGLYKRAELIGPENITEGERTLQLYEQCRKDLLSQQQINTMTTVISAAIEARKFKDADSYVSFHTRRESAQACAASYQQTQTLKSLLNL